MFDDLSQFHINEDKLYDHFNENIYMPLSLKSERKQGFSEVIYDFLENKESTIGN